MALLFISHSTRDDTLASALVSWLKDYGFADIFIDHESITGGEKWRDALRASANSCRVVIFLVTPNWLASAECFAEFGAAWYMGKRLVPLFLLPPWDTLGDEARQRLARVTGEDQGLDIKPCIGPDGALDLERDKSVADLLKTGLRAAGANMRVGLDPEAFAIDRKLRETPFPGLASFGDEDADAALFYGRSREIAEVLEALRSMRASRIERSLVIQGASGAGKSSLLKAGIIPRLRRETPAWLPLRAFRPGADPLLNFARALGHTLTDFNHTEAYGVIRDRLLAAWSKAERERADALTESGLKELISTLEAEGARLRQIADRPGATILISVDQAEEIARADGESGDALADYLRAAIVSEASPWQLAFTIRSDSLPELQKHRRFEDLKGRGYDLRAVPNFRFDTLVEEPAKRYGVEVDPDLVDALMEDAPKEDALPLLAFALQELWRQYAKSGRLTKSNYTSIGKLSGLIEGAAERALRNVNPEEPVPAAPLPKHLDMLGAATFVPSLVQINDEGATIRRVANWHEFGEEEQELLARLDRWRLVIRKSADENGGTVEVAHEALFREWTRLKGWLEPERARLEALRSLQLDAINWDRNGRDKAFLNHRERRLEEAEDLTQRERYAQRLTALDHDYLTACKKAEKAANRRARRIQVVSYALLLGIIASLGGIIEKEWIGEQIHWFWTVRPYIAANIAPFLLAREKEKALQPGETFHECAKNCPEMVVIPAGMFVMGSPDGKTPVMGLDGKPKEGPSAPKEDGRSDDEGPQHEVAIKQFAAGKFAVTFDDWDECVALGGCPQVSDSAWGRGRQPVINVSWNEAKRYAAWLSLMTGKDYRLLSESEWEYAARARMATAYSFGDNYPPSAKICEYANFADISLKKAAPTYQTSDICDDGNAVPAEVGSYKPNGFGLYDMHGNVFQWTEDCYAKTYQSAPIDGSPFTTLNCSLRVLRGGSWSKVPQFLRSASRNGVTPDFRGNSIGFRLSRTLNP